ncbi:hypothetical protein CVE36_16775 [Pseudomonas syringae pv. actinidiae]|nr:hypothetical protein [Pseudomonas syringae pv. actinidiae]
MWSPKAGGVRRRQRPASGHHHAGRCLRYLRVALCTGRPDRPVVHPCAPAPKDIRALEKSAGSESPVAQGRRVAAGHRFRAGFLRLLLEGSGNHVAATQLRQLQARISYLRATSVSQENRRGASNKEMELMVDAIKSGDPLAAHQASVDHVRNAAKVALEYLKSKQDEDTKVREIVAPVVLKEPRIGR